MEGRNSLMKTSTRSKGQRSIQEKILKEAPMKDGNGPQLFKTKSLERKFELAARSLADRPPAQLPRLINPADYANQRVRKKASTIISKSAESIQTTASVPTDIPSLPSTAQPIPDMAVARLRSNDDDMGYLFEEPEDMSNPQLVPAETEKEALARKLEELREANQATRLSIASQGFSTDAEFDLFSHVAAKTSHLGLSPAIISPSSNLDKPPTVPRRSLSETLPRTLVPHAEMRGPPMDRPPAQVRKVSLVDYAARQNGVQLKTFFGGSQVQDILLTFVDIDAQDANWRPKIQQLESITFDHMCRSTDINNHTSELSPILLARGRVITSKVDDKPAQEIIRTVADNLRVSISGLLFNSASFNIIIYPTRCEEWKFIEYGIQAHVDDQLAFFAFTSSSEVASHPWNANSEDLISKINIDGVEDYDLLNEVILGYKYQSLLLPAEKKGSADVFFLLFPNMAAPLAEHMMSWLRHCNKNCKLFTCQQVGSWLQFIKATSNISTAGTLLIHESMISLIPRYPKLLHFLANGHNNVWCIDEGFPDGKMLSRLFPQGGAVCLTPSFLFSEPKAACLFLHWFLKKRLPSSTMGTWKLVICHNFYSNVVDLAFNGGRRRKEFLENLPAGLSDSDKEVVAASKGLSLKQCNYRFQVLSLVDSLLHFKHENEIDRGCKLPDESNSPIVYADQDIDWADEEGLVNFFAFWSVINLKSFRKFIVIGTKTTIPQEGQLRPRPEPRDSTPTEAWSARLAPMPVVSEITNPTSSAKGPPAQQMAAGPKWKHKALVPTGDAPREEKETTPSAIAEQRHETDLNEEKQKRSHLDPSPVEAPQGPGPTPTWLEETPIDLNVDPLILHFIVATGASAIEAKEFLRRGGDDLVRAVKLYEIAQSVNAQAQTMPAGPASHTETTPASYSLPAFLPASYSNMPSDHPGVGESDVDMEDAPSDSPIESLATHAHPSIEQHSEHPSEPQPSRTGIITTENGARFVPSSVRVSGTIRHEIHIRPGYVPPEELYKVRRDGTPRAEGEPMSRSASESRSGGGVNRMSRESSAAQSHGGVLTPVSPMEYDGGGKDGALEVQAKVGDAKPGEKGERSEKNISILEWYAKKKKNGDGWNHVAVVGCEEAFKLLRVESK